MIRRVKVKHFEGDPTLFTALVAIGEKVKNGVSIPSGYETDDIYFYFKNGEDYRKAFTDDAESIIEDAYNGDFCGFTIVEDLGVVSEDEKWVVVNWCADPDEDAAGCFGKHFPTRDDAVKFLRNDMIKFIEKNEINLCDVNTDDAGDGCYKSVDEIPYSDDGSLWWGGVRHYWQVQQLHENF